MDSACASTTSAAGKRPRNDDDVGDVSSSPEETENSGESSREEEEDDSKRSSSEEDEENSKLESSSEEDEENSKLESSREEDEEEESKEEESSKESSGEAAEKEEISKESSGVEAEKEESRSEEAEEENSKEISSSEEREMEESSREGAEEKNSKESSSEEEKEKNEESSREEKEENSEESSREDEEEEEYYDDEVDIITVSDEETLAEEGMEVEDIIGVDLDSEKEGKHTQEPMQPESAATTVSYPPVESTNEDSERERTSASFFRNVPPNWPLQFTKFIDDQQSFHPRVLMEKSVHKFDIDENLNRFLIPWENMMGEEFLLPEEDTRLDAERRGMTVLLIEPNASLVSSITLSKWWIGDRPSFVFTTEWNQVVARNSNLLKKGAKVRLWYFRIDDGPLCFALHVLEERRKMIVKLKRKRLSDGGQKTTLDTITQ